MTTTIEQLVTRHADAHKVAEKVLADTRDAIRRAQLERDAIGARIRGLRLEEEFNELAERDAAKALARVQAKHAKTAAHG